MLLKKTFQIFLSMADKLNTKSVKCYIRTVRLNLKQKRRDILSPYSNMFFASAAAFGLSLYVAHKHKINCDTVDINLENKELNISVEHKTFDEAIRKSRDLLQRIKDEVGAPGIIIGVSVNGKTVWKEGLGFSDVENRVLCSSDTVMRIASISKSITMAAVAKLWEQGKLDLDKPVQEYVPYFPSKFFEGKPVVITCRQLISHLGGIRHYDKSSNNSKDEKDSKISDDKSSNKKKDQKTEFEFKEYYIKEKYKDVKTSVDLFKDDPLICKPGTKFFYSTHGWTLISAIVEAAAKEQFPVHMTKLFKKLGMTNTYLDNNDILIYHRSRNYLKDSRGILINAPYVDNSYKWAGGGILSTVGDLLRFGNAMLYSLQFKLRSHQAQTEKNLNFSTEDCGSENMIDKSESTNQLSNVGNTTKNVLPGYLDSKTVETMWSPVTEHKESKYGMGWFIYPEKQECQYCEKNKFCVYHTGGAIGASSVLLILPEKLEDNDLENFNWALPKGIIVTILTNLQSVNLYKSALQIAQIFDEE